ncbi:MAG: LysR family transcriptional regulator [Myxococcales bacterium]|nr:LysR family transcriptional regulator [Myxococcales bacterium]
MGVFMRVAELKSFTRAAQGLGLPKATVSGAVQRLEERVGARLLHRTTRRVELTQDGHVFYERCRDLLSDVDELEGLFRDPRQGLVGRIRVDLPSRMARLRFIPALPAFLAEHPELTLELGTTDRAVDLVTEGYDCVVRVGNLGDSGLVARRIGSMEVINVASPGYLAAHGRPRGLRDLARHQLVHYASTLGQRPDGFEYPTDEGYQTLAMAGRVVVNNAEAYIAACLAGLGIIQSPWLGLDAHIEAGELVEVLPRLRAEPMPVSIVYPHRRNLSRRVRVFMDWLAELLASSPGPGPRTR